MLLYRVIRPWFATALGDDTLSLELERRWAQDGLALDLIRHIPGRMPGLYQILVDAEGERQFIFWRDNIAANAYLDVAETPLEARIDEWDAFYFSGISLAILPADGRSRLLAFARALQTRGATVVFDNNHRPSLRLHTRRLQYVTTNANRPRGGLSFGKLGCCLPQAIQIHGTQCTVVQTIAWLAGFTPDHPAMVRPHITVETNITVGLDDSGHVE